MWLEINVNSGDPVTSAETRPWPVTNCASWWGACTVQGARAQRQTERSTARKLEKTSTGEGA